MGDILVKPPQLRGIAADLSSRAKRIENACQRVDQALAPLKGSRFLGGRADILQNRFLAQRASLLNYHLLVVGFANQLQQVATLFEKADAQADASIGMPSGQTDRKTVPKVRPEICRI